MRQIDEVELKKIQLSILNRIDTICKENGIRYFLHAGTLIGAIRHKGFIPWDDDIDLAMLRPDYERFASLFKNDKIAGLRFLDSTYSTGYVYAFGKVCDINTVLHETDYVGSEELGVYVDILPVDNQGDNLEEAKKLVKKMTILNAFLFESTLAYYHRISKKWYYEIPRFFMYPIAKAKGASYWVGKMQKLTNTYYDGENLTKYIGVSVSPNWHTVFKREWYEGSVDVEFEGELYPAPVGYHEVLTTNYGDYMKLPPENKRVSHHDFEAHYIEDNTVAQDKVGITETKRKVIGYTQGTYDMFHIGHLNLINHAREYCDYLIVGVNSDTLVQSYKNKTPVINEIERQEIVSNIKAVDRCVIAQTLDKVAVWKELHFDVIFIGDDWKGNERWTQTEKDLEPYGAKVVYLPHTDGISSTELTGVIKNILGEKPEKPAGGGISKLLFPYAVDLNWRAAA